MRNVKRYGLLGNIEDAHYVRYTIDAARLAGLSPEVDPASRQPSCGSTNVAAVAAGALVLEGKSPVTASDGDSPPEVKRDGAGREAANGLTPQQKRGKRGAGAKTRCGAGLGNSNRDHLEASVLKVDPKSKCNSTSNFALQGFIHRTVIVHTFGRLSTLTERGPTPAACFSCS